MAQMASSIRSGARWCTDNGYVEIAVRIEKRIRKDELGWLDLWLCADFECEAQGLSFPNIANHCGSEAGDASATDISNAGIHEAQGVLVKQMLCKSLRRNVAFGIEAGRERDIAAQIVKTGCEIGEVIVIGQ